MYSEEHIRAYCPAGSIKTKTKISFRSKELLFCADATGARKLCPYALRASQERDDLG